MWHQEKSTQEGEMTGEDRKPELWVCPIVELKIKPIKIFDENVNLFLCSPSRK
jgi:hypothetical protein